MTNPDIENIAQSLRTFTASANRLANMQTDAHMKEAVRSELELKVVPLLVEAMAAHQRVFGMFL